jgi:hypothetical protein
VFAAIAVVATAMSQIFTSTYQKSLDCNALQLLYHTSPLISMVSDCNCDYFCDNTDCDDSGDSDGNSDDDNDDNSNDDNDDNSNDSIDSNRNDDSDDI